MEIGWIRTARCGDHSARGRKGSRQPMQARCLPEWGGAGGEGKRFCYHFCMAEVTLASTVCHAPNPVAADVAGETVLMSLERSRCYGLGEIGSEIWSRLRSPVTVSELVDEFSTRYEAPPGVIAHDVLGWLEQLAAEGLIQVR